MKTKDFDIVSWRETDEQTTA